MRNGAANAALCVWSNYRRCMSADRYLEFILHTDYIT